MHSLTNWRTEMRHAPAVQVGQYAAAPTNVDLRRKTVVGVESVPNALAQLQSVRKEEGKNRHFTSALKQNASMRSLGLRADVPHGVDMARSSMLASITCRHPLLPPLLCLKTLKQGWRVHELKAHHITVSPRNPPPVDPLRPCLHITTRP